MRSVLFSEHMHLTGKIHSDLRSLTARQLVCLLIMFLLSCILSCLLVGIT
jgi:hypothetical protein